MSPPRAAPVQRAGPVEGSEPWEALQQLPHTEHEAFLARVARGDPALASALVARVVREGVPACFDLVFDDEEPWDRYESVVEGWSDDASDALPQSATLKDPCVGLIFVDSFASEYLTDQDSQAIADELVTMLDDDPGGHDEIWETVSGLVPVSAASESWAWIRSRAPDYPTESDIDLEARVSEHINSAPPEARRMACTYAAKQRDNPEAAMWAAECLAKLGDDSALPSRHPGQSLGEVAFMLRMLAFARTPAGRERSVRFAAPQGVRMLDGEIGGAPAIETGIVSPDAWSLPWGRDLFPSHEVRGPDCTPGPPATCNIRRGRFQGQIENLKLMVIVRFEPHPEGSWVVTEVTEQSDPLAAE